jgi:tetratricopeptide (TPR) repeat protein
MQIGLVYEDLDREDRAEAEYLLAIELAPDETAFREYLATYYEGRGRFADAALQYEQILEIDPGNEAARMNLEQITRRLQKPSSGQTGLGGD